MLQQTLDVPSLREFIGQPKLVQVLREEVAAAKAIHRPVGNCLFFGPGGLGKTSLVMAVAAEVKCRVHKLIGSQLNEESLTTAIGNCNDAGCDEQGLVSDHAKVVPDILYINEAHNGNAKALEMLHDIMEPDSNGRRVFFAKEPGSSERRPAWCPPVTVVIDTNFLGKIKKRNGALITRCQIKWSFEPYDPEDIAKIIIEEVKRRGRCAINKEAVALIAQRCLGIPRTAKILLDRAESRLFSLIEGNRRVTKMITAEIAGDAINMLGIDQMGLEPLAREYLRVLASNRNAKMSLQTIAAGVGADVETITVDVEPFLLRSQLVRVVAGGRQITETGLQHIGVGSANPIRRRFLSNVEL